MTEPIWSHETDLVSAELVENEACSEELKLRLIGRGGDVQTVLTAVEVVDLMDALAEWLGVQ